MKLCFDHCYNFLLVDVSIIQVIIIKKKLSIRIYLYDYFKMCCSEVMCSYKLYTPWSIHRKFTADNFFSRGSHEQSGVIIFVVTR